MLTLASVIYVSHGHGFGLKLNKVVSDNIFVAVNRQLYGPIPGLEDIVDEAITDLINTDETDSE